MTRGICLVVVTEPYSLSPVIPGPKQINSPSARRIWGSKSPWSGAYEYSSKQEVWVMRGAYDKGPEQHIL